MKTLALTSIDIADPSLTHHDTDSPTLLLVYTGTDNAVLDPGLIESAVLDPLSTAFAAVQRHWRALTAAAENGRLVIAAPAHAALGDPDRPLDSAVVGALISFVRSVAIELRKSNGSANTVLFEQNVSESGCAEVIRTLITSTRTATGQEIFVTDGLDLGRLHP